MTNATGITAIIPAPTEEVFERPLTVCIRPYGLDFVEYHGSRAQLEAEGVIPAGTEWPEGRKTLKWINGLFLFTLHRDRPKEATGPMKLWITCDYWSVRWERKVQQDHGARAISDKEKELAEVIYRESAEGRRANNALWNLYSATHNDKAFQAFRSSIIPTRKKSGRPTKSGITTQIQGATA